MIVRYPLKCDTCEEAHTTRIGMGQEETQTHKFSCRKCGEQITVRLDVDYMKIAHEVACVENCSPTAEVAGAHIVNLEANFLIPADEQGVDFAFPRMRQHWAFMEAAAKRGTLTLSDTIPDDAREARPFRRPNFAEEWKDLRKAWSLARNNQDKLVAKRVIDGSKRYYANDPLTDLPDWMWRFALFMCQPSYELRFLDVMEMLKPLWASEHLQEFKSAYEKTLRERGTRYLGVMQDYFAADSEFGQVYFHVAKGVPLPEEGQASSTDFDAVKLFYGNTYEHFTSLVDLLAMLNNMLAGRRHDIFEVLTMSEYRKLDKPARFGPFSDNPTFMAMCEEADNQIRNASHHGSIGFDAAGQLVVYRAGKGGTGKEHTMPYVTYLERCVRLFLQVLSLLRVELVLSRALKSRTPI